MSRFSVAKTALAVLAVVVVVELGARWWPAEPTPPHARVGFAWMERGDVYAHDPDLGWTFRPSTHLGVAGQDVRTNALGLRGVEPRSPAVLCVGDGVVVGIGVAESETWPARLGAQLGVEVLAAGAPGWSSVQAKVMLERLLRSYRPQAVILAVGATDGQSFPLADEPEPASWYGASAVVQRLHERRRRNAMADVMSLRALAVASHEIYPPSDEAAVARFVALQGQFEQVLGRGRVRVPVASFTANLKAMIAMVEAVGARPILLAPVFGSGGLRPRFGDLSYRVPVRAYRQAMQEVARGAGVPFVSVPPMTDDGQGSARAHLFLARAMSDDEARALRLLPLSLSADKGFNLERRSVVDLGLPSAAGHALVAESLAPSLTAAVRGGDRAVEPEAPQPNPGE